MHAFISSLAVTSKTSNWRGLLIWNMRKGLHMPKIVKVKRKDPSSHFVSSGTFLGPFSCVGVILILFRLSGYPILSHYTATYLKETGMKLDDILVSLIIGMIRLTCCLAVFLFIPLATKRCAFITFGSLGTLGMLISKLLRWSQICQKPFCGRPHSLSVAIHYHLQEAMLLTPGCLKNVLCWMPLLACFLVTALQHVTQSSST